MNNKDKVGRTDFIDKENCRESITMKENILEEIFLQIYNTIIQRKYKTKDKLLNATKEIITEDNTKTKLNKFYKEKKFCRKDYLV